MLMDGTRSVERTRSVRGRVGVAKGVGPEGGNPLPTKIELKSPLENMIF
jgi:hypothetical protein